MVGWALDGVHCDGRGYRGLAWTRLDGLVRESSGYLRTWRSVKHRTLKFRMALTGALFLGSPRQKRFLHLGMFAAVNFKDLHLTLRVSSTRYFTLSRFEQTRETVKNQCVAQMLLNLIIVVES